MPVRKAPPARPDDDLRALQRRVREGPVPGLQEVLESCGPLFGVAASALVLGDSDDRVLRVAAWTDPIAHQLCLAQAEAGEGPAVDAFLHDRLVETADIILDERWEAIGSALSSVTVAAVICVPVSLSGIAVGALELHTDAPRTWDDADRRALVSYGDVIGSILASVAAAHRAGELAAQLAHALEYRVVIERGIGYLMARDGLGPAAAFEKLRRAARDSRRKISDLAADLLATGALLSD